MKDDRIALLEQKARVIRYAIVHMIGVGKPGHLGGSCSIADVVAALYFYKMRHDPKRPEWTHRDRFLLSKGHAALAQYAALAECGYFPKKQLDSLKQLGSMLQGHPDRSRVPGIEANTGSLGQGLSIACGMALAARLDDLGHRIYCVVGDGESAEGQIWEAAMVASAYKLDHLTVILDNNELQATGPIVEIFDTNPIPEKWRAFGWHVIEMDGHDIKQIISALDQVDEIIGKPTLLIAHTIKGKGVSFAERNPAFHNGAMTEEQFHQACAELRPRESGA